MTEQDARDFSVSLGAEIAYWRKRRGLTREQLAEKVGASATTIGRIERGSEDAAAAASLVWRIASHLGLHFSELVRRAEDAGTLSEGTPSLSIAADETPGRDEEAEAPDTP